MKAIHGLVGVGLGLLSLVGAEAQNATCSAVVTKKSVHASTKRERAWDIQFDVNVNGCASSSGTFDYVVDLAEKGTVESRTATAGFRVEKAGLNTITVTYAGPAFKDLKDVREIKVKTCSCEE